ncbi:valine--tRNA ligase [Candidatus Woesearchaeota archaeon]|jgi:valyl-tRNA synthetase|nr:valine--tRNA ligase [Candidatus Woesearchaeota archaeon]MBT6519450.1 valine--tRNA ligase [Candidatus Woesearchaeota archaeon]MBT7368888.1 valine--tRNA ligase [Candidatus Woesearchaeota archaeon]
MSSETKEQKQEETEEEFPKRYDPKVEEPHWQKFWDDNQISKFDPKDTTRKIFSIDTPPPTVSGKMHLGHAFGNSQQDFIARFKRMNGFNVLQPFGTDDNGLPTQTLIQKLKHVRAKDLGRTKFSKLCIETLENELKPTYLADWKRLGISCDFDVKYSTIDPHSRKVSQKSFIDLYNAGRQYRIDAPAMFCPHCKTAIAQVECEDKDIASFFNDIVFKITTEDGKEEELIIATTRPELLPACVAIFYHPEDKRFHHLRGKTAKVPLYDMQVPILEDKRADPQKGTGIVMCCTFGDQTDCEWQKAHKLPIIEAIGKDGKMTEVAGKYQGNSPEIARKLIIEDLKDSKLLLTQKPITHAVNVHERCETPVEFIQSKQWFIKYLDLKDKMLEWGNELKWFPHHMKNRYDNWVNCLAWDWCISRQIFFGIPFPVWYCKDCDEVILAKEEDLPVDPLEQKPPIDECPKCKCKEFIGEKDIINTWATSSLTPTIVKELFKGEPCYEKLKSEPMSLRPQGHDIISFWLFNTVVKSQLHHNMLPWNDCFINGWMLDPKGKKMSKSKGNVVEPQVMIEKYCADALRFMAAGCSLGEDLPFPEKELVAGTKTLNKIWNASRFALMHLENFDPNSIDKEKIESNLEVIDKWLISKLNKVIKAGTDSFEKHEFSKCRSETDKFFWQVFCDNYLELCKYRIYSEDIEPEKKLSAQYTIYKVLLATLKLYSPFLPHITEAIYQRFFKEFESDISIHISKWPKFEENLINETSENAGDLAVDIVGAIRKYKSENQLSLKSELPELNIDKPEFEDKINLVIADICAVTHAKGVKFGKLNKEPILTNEFGVGLYL